MKDRYGRDVEEVEKGEKTPGDHVVMSSLMTILYIGGTAYWVGTNLALPKAGQLDEKNIWKL